MRQLSQRPCLTCATIYGINQLLLAAFSLTVVFGYAKHCDKRCIESIFGNNNQLTIIMGSGISPIYSCSSPLGPQTQCRICSWTLSRKYLTLVKPYLRRTIMIFNMKRLKRHAETSAQSFVSALSMSITFPGSGSMYLAELSISVLTSFSLRHTPTASQKGWCGDAHHHCC
jgi:hypothetical protein